MWKGQRMNQEIIKLAIAGGYEEPQGWEEELWTLIQNTPTKSQIDTRVASFIKDLLQKKDCSDKMIEFGNLVMEKYNSELLEKIEGLRMNEPIDDEVSAGHDLALNRVIKLIKNI
jgi:hypothetical protein